MTFSPHFFTKTKLFFLLFPSIYLIFISPPPISATTFHQTLIINQVRGAECCSPGELEHVRAQLRTLEQLQLPATFALRFDVLNDEQFLKLLRPYFESKQIELSAFLEITPSWAAAAGVEYTGNADNWYEAQHAYLIGYEPAARRQLIDTYMERFLQVLGRYPRSSTAWMIDAWSLGYLGEAYEIGLHQITREQLGVDSYTLYGGPAHYPYYPSPNWPLVPARAQAEQLPVIVRQTITDPVHNYGDDSSAFTSQPNDYARRQADFSYFQHLFLQAHSQTPLQDSFALIGLENSMPADIQQEYRRQLAFVADWRDEAPETRLVQRADQFAPHFRSSHAQNPALTLYAGQDQLQADEQAWWITTPFYRVRLRLSAGELFISDWRFYDESLTDPYLEKSASKLGWWIVPFLVDGSRYPLNDQSLKFDRLQKDSLTLPHKFQPTRLQLATGVDAAQLEITTELEKISVRLAGQTLAVFLPEQVGLPKTQQALLNNPLFNKLQQDQYLQLQVVEQQDGLDFFQIITSDQADWLQEARQRHYPLLFPELSEHPLDPQYSYLYKNNRYAIAGRNPVRLVFFPQDQYGYPVSLSKTPRVSTDPAVDDISIYQQSGQNGMIFIDFNHSAPQQVTAHIEQDGWQEKVKIYFAPDCKNNWRSCLLQPQHAWWYLNTIVHDKWRALKEKINEKI